MGIMFLTGEYLPVDAGADLVFDVSPRIEQVADLRVACLTGEIDCTAQSIVQIVLSALLSAQAQESVGIVVMGNKAVVAGVSIKFSKSN